MPWRWRPLLPCPIVPAKKMPGTVALSHQGVWAGSRLAPNVATPSSGRSTSGHTNPVAEMTSSTSTRQVAAAVGPAQADVERAIAAGDPLDAFDGRIEDGDAATQDVVLVRLDVAGPDADQRPRVDRQLGVRRRDEDELARPRQQAVGQLEPGVLLADDAARACRRTSRPARTSA